MPGTICRRRYLVHSVFCLLVFSIASRADEPAVEPMDGPIMPAVACWKHGSEELRNARTRVYRAAEKQAHYLLSTVQPWSEDPGLKLLTESRSGEHWIRPNTGTVAGFAFLYRFGPYDEKTVGVSREELMREFILPMMRYLIVTHRTGSRPTSDGKPWGDHWQSAHWAHSLAHAAWWAWEDLPTDVRAGVRRVVAHEADRIAAAEPPHQIREDSKSEENAWNSEVLSVAVLLMPDDPRRPRWETAFQKWALSSYLRPADETSDAVVDGRPVREQFTGANIYDDYTLENHGIVHPDYMAAFNLTLGSSLDYSMTGRRPPEALRYNIPGIYENLKWFLLPDGGFVYPNGQDWRLFRNPDWLFVHVSMAVFGKDPDAWPLALTGLETLERMQARSESGAIYRPGEYFFPSTQHDRIYHLALTWLSLQLVDSLPHGNPERTGVRRLDSGKVVIHRTPEAIHTFSWGARCMAQCLAYRPDRIVSPDYRSGIGHVRAAGTKDALPARLHDATVTSNDDSFVAEVIVDHGENQIRANLTFRSNPDGTWVTREKLVALADVTTNEIATGLIGILNNPTWVYETGRREIALGDRQTTVPSCSGVVLDGAGVTRVSIDSALRMDSAEPLRVRYVSAEKADRGRVTDYLYLNHLGDEHVWHKGDVISEYEVTVRCELAPTTQPTATSPKEDGYRGIWFTLGQLKGPYGDKYSGGLGTYTAKHVPIAVYAPEADKTFFVYGGTAKDKQHLLIMASFYDHARGVVPRPTIVHDKGGVKDPHDNSSLCLDEKGYVWVFVSGRGRQRLGFKYRSMQPYSVDAFELVTTEEMTYPQPWFLPDQGFLHLFTKYTKGRELYWETSADGSTWSEDAKLAGFGGHYQVSGRHGGLVATAFNWHPQGSVDKRTNLYFMQTNDAGKSWHGVSGKVLATPLEAVSNDALVRDYAREGLLVYMKDLNFDADGRPVILYVTSKGHDPGPQNDPRTWTVAHWTGQEWAFREVTRSDHNYDTGSLYIEPDGTWRVVAPTEPGPQPYGTGGEMAAWISTDQGATWRKAAQLTRASERNHSYARRPVNAHPGFYTLWADGDAFQVSPSRLYFANKAGDKVHVLPECMKDAIEPPRLLQQTGTRQTVVGVGWARNAVNANTFRQHSVTTHGDTQYTAFYDAEARMVLAQRRLGSADWETHITQYKGNVRDAHNGISIAVDGTGLLHVAWDHHGHPLRYARGKQPGSLELTEMLPMTGQAEQHVTYPEFFNLDDGDLLFLYRDGGSGCGLTMLNRYDAGTQTWSAVQHPLIDGEGQRNAYTNQIAIDRAGGCHISWNWRETGDVATNHDLCYARSTDQGRTWTRSNGRAYTLPITAATAEIACAIPQNSDLINQCATAVDSRGRPMIATYWRPAEAQVPQYHLVWYDGSEWRVSQIGSRSTPFTLRGGGTKRIPISRPKLAVDGHDRVCLLFRDEERGNRLSMAVSEDPRRQSWRTIDLTLDDIGFCEPTYDGRLWRRDGMLHVFVQRAGQGDAETLEDLPPQPVRIVEWKPDP